jgi:serine/threonine-protein kinase ATR
MVGVIIHSNGVILTTTGPLLDTIRSCCPTENELTDHALPFAAEAAWMTGKWGALAGFLRSEVGTKSTDFNVGIGKAIVALNRGEEQDFSQIITSLRENVVQGLSMSSTASLAAAHPFTLKLHALYELDQMATWGDDADDSLMESLNRRLDIVGAFTDDKQYLLGLRRAVMLHSRYVFLINVAHDTLTRQQRLLESTRSCGLVD